MNADHVTGLQNIRGDIDALTVHGKVAVRYHLTGLCAAGGKSQAVDDVVKARFQQAQQVFAGNAGQAQSFLQVVAERVFQNAVHAAQFLLFAQLLAVFRYFAREGGCAVHSRRLVAPFGFAVAALLINCAVGEALVALEVQFQALAATLATPGIVIISHIETDAPCGLLLVATK